MGKLLWLDVETTGLNPKTSAIIQLSGLVEIDGHILDSFNYRVRPFPNAVIEEGALKVNNTTKEEILNYPYYQNVFQSFRSVLNRHVDRFDKSDKFVFAGYNVSFDDSFLRNFFALNGDKYYGSLIAFPKLDVAGTVAKKMYLQDLTLENYKLETVCNHYGIFFNAHDSMADIVATRKLFYTLEEMEFEEYEHKGE